jgi:hypothetical protein
MPSTSEVATELQERMDLRLAPQGSMDPPPP